MRIISVIAFSGVLGLSGLSDAGNPWPQTIRTHQNYKPYAGKMNKKGMGDVKACESHYKGNPEYKKLTQEITNLQRQERSLRGQIKRLLGKNPCPNQEYTIEVGEAIVAGLQAQVSKLEGILKSLENAPR